MSNMCMWNNDLIGNFVFNWQRRFKKMKSYWRRWNSLSTSHSERFANFIEDVDDGFVYVDAIRYKKDDNYSMFMIEYKRGSKKHIDFFAIENMSEADKANLEKLKKITKLEVLDWE